jgi:hypothetical protein
MPIQASNSILHVPLSALRCVCTELLGPLLPETALATLLALESALSATRVDDDEKERLVEQVREK